MCRDKLFNRCDESCARSFHVCRPTAIQHAILDGGFEWRRMPLLNRAGRHDVGMTGKYQQRAAGAAPRIKVVYIAETHVLYPEAQLGQAFDHDLLTTGIVSDRKSTRLHSS